MKILITGATGLVGTELVELLLRSGVAVNYLTTSPAKIVSEPNYKGFYWNPQQGIVDENALANVDAIIHLAGASISKRWTQNYKQEIIESRIVSANLLYKLLKKNPHRVSQFISASAIGIYPDSLSRCYTETDVAVDGSFLGNVVVKWEESVDKFRRLGLKVCKIRTGLVLSEKGGILPEILMPVRAGVASAFGSGKQWQSWIHISDLIRIYCFALEHQLDGIYNAVAPNPVNNAQLVKQIAQKMNKPFFMPKIPKVLMKMLFGEMHILMFTSQKVSSAKVSESGFDFQYKILSSALSDLLK